MRSPKLFLHVEVNSSWGKKVSTNPAAIGQIDKSEVVAELAAETLQAFETIASAAGATLGGKAAGVDSFAAINELTAARAVQNLGRIQTELASACRKLREEPAIARLVVADENDRRETLYVYSVFAHELTHWTGAKPRLDRDLTGRFGSEAYAMEELVAELGAAFVLGHLELSATPRPDHAAYIASWLKVLRDDPRAILTAAGRAQAAADYLIAAISEVTEGAAALHTEMAEAA